MSELNIKNLTPSEAWDILQENPAAVLIDVRSSMEYDYVGHPANAINVPWQEPPAWAINPDFIDQVRRQLTSHKKSNEPVEQLPVLTICRSGKRSLAAAEALARSGFNLVYNIEQGFEGDRDGAKHRSTINGWRFQNLPWEQS